MLGLVNIFGVVLAGMGAVFLLSPAMFKRSLVFWQQGSRPYMAVALRLIMGVVVLYAAS